MLENRLQVIFYRDDDDDDVDDVDDNDDDDDDDDYDADDDDDATRKACFINLISEMSERNFDRPGRLTSRTGGKSSKNQAS